jgi:hypothetical protein
MSPEQLAGLLRKIPSLQFEVEAVGDADLIEICRSAINNEKPEFAAPRNASRIDLHTTIDILNLAASYISVGVAVWAAFRQEHRPVGSIDNQSLDRQIRDIRPDLEKLPTETRLAACDKIQHDQ